LGARIHTAEEAGKILDIFQKHGHNEVDSARVYGNGSTEEILGELDWQKRGLIMDTKLYPNAGRPMVEQEQYTRKPEDVRKGLMQSLQALKCTKIDIFNRFGISNYMSWEVAKICEICDKHGWIKPTVYQGIYNAMHRSIEAELFPCLRHYGISLYAFQPLAGGFLTGRYKRNQDHFEPGSRFDPGIAQGALHRGRYWNDAYFDALEAIEAAAGKHGLTVAECALRWVEHHSQMKSELNDAIIVGASSTRHLEGNLVDLEKGPLPEDVVEALEEAWMKVKAVAPKYWH
jgi:aflatoxin B1 aldehyde reductase